MGAGYAETTDATAAGASAFYTLVLLTIALCGMVPSLLQRLAHKRFTKGTALLALLCAGAAVGASGLRPEAQAWADAAAAFDPHEILRVPEGANATVVRRSYRSLSRTHHPDKGGDAKAFRKIALAHAALAGAPSERRNYRDFGHPEGPRTSVAGFALPRGFEAIALIVYAALLALVVLPVVALVRGARRPSTPLPRKATILALRDALAGADAPRTCSGFLLLLGKLLDDHEALGDLPAVSDQDRGKLPGRAASALDKDAKAAGAPLTPSGAFLVRRALGDAGRRLDEAGPEAAAEDAALTLAAPLARAAVELASAAWRPSSILDVAVAAHQCVVHPERGDAPPAKILELKVAVYDDEEALPDVRAGDLATCDVRCVLNAAAASDWLLVLAHGDGKVSECRPVVLPDEPLLRGDRLERSMRVRLFVPKRVGAAAVVARVVALDARGLDSAPKKFTYRVEAQLDE